MSLSHAARIHAPCPRCGRTLTAQTPHPVGGDNLLHVDGNNLLHLKRKMAHVDVSLYSLAGCGSYDIVVKYHNCHAGQPWPGPCWQAPANDGQSPENSTWQVPLCCNRGVYPASYPCTPNQSTDAANGTTVMRRRSAAATTRKPFMARGREEWNLHACKPRRAALCDTTCPCVSGNHACHTLPQRWEQSMQQRVSDGRLSSA